MSILDECDVAGLRLKNRVGLAPLNTGLLRADGALLSSARPFYKLFHDSGLIYIGGIAVQPNGRANGASLCLDAVEKIDGLARVVKDAHNADVKVFVQLEHAGRQTRTAEIGEQTVAASALPCAVIKDTPRALSITEIDDIIAAFSKAAALSDAAGANGIEIHAAHGYLLAGFLSNISNHRSDKYGGSAHNRFRIVSEVVDSCRDTVPVPVGIRINCVEYISQSASSWRERLLWIKSNQHRLDFVSLAAGMYAHDDLIMPKRKLGRGIWQDFARELKAEIKIPVFLAGNIDSIHCADRLFKSRALDVALMGRHLLATPDMISKSLINPDYSSQCTYCKMCKYHTRGEPHIYCPFNPALNGRK